MLSSEIGFFCLGSCFLLEDELCPGKCKGNSRSTVASVPGTAVGLLEQKLDSTLSHGVMSSVVVAS